MSDTAGEFLAMVAANRARERPALHIRWQGEHGEIRVMATVEGYVVARYKGAMPFVMWQKDFVEQFTPVLGASQ